MVERLCREQLREVTELHLLKNQNAHVRSGDLGGVLWERAFVICWSGVVVAAWLEHRYRVYVFEVVTSLQRGLCIDIECLCLSGVVVAAWLVHRYRVLV